MVKLNRTFLVEEYGKEKLLNLTEIKLNGKGITEIDSNTFIDFSKLEELELIYNALEEIDVRSFEGLSNLKVLSLTMNKLKKIDSNTFKNLAKLETLLLINNEIEEIDVRSFEGLLNLNELYLNYNLFCCSYSTKSKKIFLNYC